jgi:hypothetical protein
MDGTGRQVCKDSYYNKSAGCNSATDRVNVENDISRPAYMEYITLSANGIAGDIYGKTDAYKNSELRHRELDDINNITGNFGKQFGSAIQTTCGYHSYNKHDDHHGLSSGQHHGSGNAGVAHHHQNGRQAHAMRNGYNAQQHRQQSGF